MISYTEFIISVRQIANGSMAISAFFVIAVFARYIWTYWDQRKTNAAVQAAIAILILTIGHMIRSLSSWIEFIWIDLKWDPTHWVVESWSWFILAAVLVLVGKILMLLNFAPWKLRKCIAGAAIIAAIVIPIVLAIMIN